MIQFKKQALLLGILFLSFFSMAGGISFRTLSLQEALDEAKKQDNLVFIDVYATWCGPCKYLSANVFTDEDLGAYMNEHFISLKLDGEKGDGLGLMNKHQLNSYPTMLFMNPNGEVLKKIVGAVEAEEIMNASTLLVDPESSPIFQMEQKYMAGNRTQAFLQEYLMLRLENDLDVVELADEYFALFPNLTMEDENDFIIFYMGSDDLENPKVIDFLANSQHYADINMEYASQKYEAILTKAILTGLELESEAYVLDAIDRVFPASGVFYPEEEISKEEFTAVLLSPFEEE